MILARRHAGDPVVVGTVRVDRRTKNLAKRLQPGEIAVIDHEDIDRVVVEQLLQRRVGAVVNASACISGRYPTEGPILLAAAGVPVVDCVGPSALTTSANGTAPQR